MAGGRLLAAALGYVVAWIESAIVRAAGLLGALLTEATGAYRGTTLASPGAYGGTTTIPPYDAMIGEWSRVLPVPVWAALGAGLLFWALRARRAAPYTASHAAGSSAPRWLGEVTLYAAGLGILYAIVRWKQLL